MVGLLIVLCFLVFIFCWTKKSRIRVRDQQFKENLGRYVDVVREVKPRPNEAVNLDDVSEHVIPMLNSNVPQSYETASRTSALVDASGNEASNEVSEHENVIHCQTTKWPRSI